MSGTRKKFNIHSRGTQDRLFCFILLLPAIILCITFIIIPIIDSVWMSFTDYKIANLTQGIPGKWNNFANYTRLWDSGKLQSAAGITIFFVFVTVLLTFIVSMTLALILNTKIVGARFLRSIMMIPWVIPTVIAGLLWAWIYANPYGLLQYLVSIFSGGKITGFGILNNQSTALWGIIIAALWKQIPLMALLLLSGMQSIPDDMLEAAKIDGANYINCLFRIIIPHMKSVIAVTVSMCIIENFKQYPLFATLLGTGMRIGECTGLTWNDVDFKRRCISVNHAATYYTRNGVAGFAISRPKTEAGIRQIPMMDAVYNALKNEYDRQKKDGFCTYELDGVSGFIFSNKLGLLHNPHCVNLAIKRIYEAHNAREIIDAKREHREPIIIPHFSCHVLRHTFCSRLCESDMNVKVIQEIMGHKNVETTLDIYTEVNYNKKKDSLEELASKMQFF